MKKTLRVFPALLIGFCTVVPVLAADAAPSRHVLTPDDFYNTQTLSEPQVSPDGKWVAYVVTTNDRESDEPRSAVWMVSWDGTQQIPLTNPAHGISTPRWSRDGRYLSYLATPAGTDKSQVMLLDRRGGEARALTTVTDDIQAYEWSPDSKRLVLVIEQDSTKEPNTSNTPSSSSTPAKPGSTPPPTPIVIDSLHFKQDKDGYIGVGHNRHLYLVDVDSKRVDPLTTGSAFNDELPVWSPDGRRIAFVRSRERGFDPDGMTDIDLIDAQPGAQSTHLTRIYAPNQQKLTWGPDAATLMLVLGEEAKYGQYMQDHIGTVKVGGGEPESITYALDRSVSSYVLTGPTTITATVDDDTSAYPVSINTRTHASKKLVQGPFVVSDLTAAAGHTAALSSNDTSPAEVYALEGEHLRKLTRHNDAFVASLELGTTEDIHFNSQDGTPIHGLMVKPPHYEAGRKYPTLLWIHGGPNLQDDHSLAFDGYQFKRQMLAAPGFVVIGINYRGSSGRGRAFSRAIFRDWGHLEVQDLLAGIDYLVAQGIADPDRLAIGGWSYGGMLTDYTIASDGRFKAAAAGAGTGNPLGTYASDEYYTQYNTELGDPWKSPDIYARLGYPLLHADRIHTPTLFMGGDKDFNVPVVGGEQMYLALRTLGVPAKLIVYPGEYHTLTRPSFIKDRVERLTGWFSQYLLSSSR